MSDQKVNTLYKFQILRIRNEKVFHTPSMNVEKKEFKDHTDKMIVFLKNFLPDTNDAISKIHTVKLVLHHMSPLD